MNLINTTMPRVSCRIDENPDKKKFEKKNLEIFFFQIFFSQDFHHSKTNPWHGGVYKVHGKSRLQVPLLGDFGGMDDL